MYKLFLQENVVNISERNVQRVNKGNEPETFVSLHSWAVWSRENVKYYTKSIVKSFNSRLPKLMLHNAQMFSSNYAIKWLTIYPKTNPPPLKLRSILGNVLSGKMNLHWNTTNSRTAANKKWTRRVYCICSLADYLMSDMLELLKSLKHKRGLLEELRHAA